MCEACVGIKVRAHRCPVPGYIYSSHNSFSNFAVKQTLALSMCCLIGTPKTKAAEFILDTPGQNLTLDRYVCRSQTLAYFFGNRPDIYGRTE